MKRLGQIQIILSMILAISAGLAWFAYRQSIRDVLVASAQVSTAGTKMAELCRIQVHDSQGMVKSYGDTCASAQEAVIAVKGTYVSVKQQIPQARKIANDLATDLEITGGLCKKIGDKINIGIPCGIHMDGWTPALTWAHPLAGVQAGAFDLERQMKSAQQSLISFDKDVLTKLDDPNDKVIDALDQASKSLDISSSKLISIANKDLPQLEASILQVEKQMGETSNGIGNSIVLFDAVILLILAMAATFFVNGVIVTKLAIKHSDGN